MTRNAMSKAELIAELTTLRQRIDELEAKQQQVEVEREPVLAAEWEQRALEEALAQERDLLHALMDNIPDPVYFKGANLCFTRVNKSYARVLGCDNPAEVIGKTDFDFQSHELAQAIYEEEQEIIKTGTPIIGRIEFNPTHDQQPRWFSTTKAPLLNETGQVIGLVGVLHDITVLGQTAAALRESEATQGAILEALPDLMFRLSRDGVYLDFSAPQADDLAGPPDQLVGKKLSEVLPPELAQQFMDSIEQVCQTGITQTLEYELLLQGKVKHFEARLVRSRADEVLTIVRNITDRKQAEETLRASQQRLELALKGADLGLWVLNVHTGEDIVDWRAAEMLGYTLDEIEPHLHWWDERTHPDDLPRVQEAWDAHLEGKTAFYECEYRLRTKSGGWKWILDRGKIVEQDKNGQPLRLTGTHLDITERKQAEAALQIQNEQLQIRNRELDAYARTVAHDLKNPLGTLTTMTEVLAQDYTTLPPEQLGEYLQSIIRSGHKAIRIVEGLLLLAGVRQRRVTLQPVDMASVVAETREHMADMIEEYQAEIITPSAWPTVLGYAPWVEEVWTNYLSNALKYGGQPPRLELGVLIQEDGVARFWVKDNGPGLTPEAQAQLFAEFTQLDPDRSDGYGLGLSIVRRIVEKLGGRVWVESEGIPGRGSTFNFTLPLAHP